MAAKGNTVVDKEGWFEKPLNLVITLIGAASSMFLAGFYIGDFKKDLEQQVVNIRKEQECNEKVLQEKEKCSEYRKTVEAEKIESLTKTIESLKSIKIDK